MNEGDLQGWAIPGLTFVKISGADGSKGAAQEESETGKSCANHKNLSEASKRIYLMGDALFALNCQRAHVAFLMLGNTASLSYFMGMALQPIPQGLGENDVSEICYNLQKSILHSAYSKVDIHTRAYSAETVRGMMEPLANNVGIATGFTPVKNRSEESSVPGLIQSIASGMNGLEFGMLVLASPLTSSVLKQEEFIVPEQPQNGERDKDEDEENNLSVNKYLDSQAANLKHKLEQIRGNWLVGVYFFAPREYAFVRLMSLVKATLAEEESHPGALRIHVVRGLKKYMLEFALLRNLPPSTGNNNSSKFKLLTLMSSNSFATFIGRPFL